MSEQNKEVGVTSYMPGTDGFTMACFHAKDVPVGTKLYVASKSPAPIPEQVAQAESGAKEMAEQLRRYHELEVWDWDILLNAANTIERLLATQSAKQGARPTDDHLWDETLRDRDTYHEWADKLAGAIAIHFGAEIGEHSNMNCPWHEALEVIESAAPITQEVTQQAAKAETAEQAEGEQAHVTPPFAAPAAPATQLMLVMAALHDARSVAMQNVVGTHIPKRADFDRIAKSLDIAVQMIERAEAARHEQMSMAGAAKGGETCEEKVSDLAPTTSTVSASGNSSKNSSSSEGDQAAVDDVRNQALEEAVEAADAAYLSAQCSIERGEFSQPIRQTREAIEAAIRALRTTPTAAQAAADKSED